MSKAKTPKEMADFIERLGMKPCYGKNWLAGAALQDCLTETRQN